MRRLLHSAERGYYALNRIRTIAKQMGGLSAAHALDYQLDAPKKVKDKLVHASALM